MGQNPLNLTPKTSKMPDDERWESVIAKRIQKVFYVLIHSQAEGVSKLCGLVFDS